MHVLLVLFLRAFFAAKSMMTASKVIVSVTLLSSDRIAKFVSLVWLMVDLMNLSFKSTFRS